MAPLKVHINSKEQRNRVIEKQWGKDFKETRQTSPLRKSKGISIPSWESENIDETLKKIKEAHHTLTSIQE